ncbi:putative transmembrane protein [Fulvivirga imtechensis AK7]|uniref:Putative transmembrane protein n=2 Tax=Fulvivirga TaxID=396811 RepID=L8K1T5_9BACT|nr:putative transmembrane protein [Fulvivirga imtechensis AK7]
MLVLCMIFSGSASLAQIGENRLKSVWMEKFSRFIEWPDTDTSEYFVIAILGNGEINHALEDLYSERTIKGRPVRIKVIENAHDLNGCNILFVNSDHDGKLDEIVRIVRSKPILTIGDTDGFAKRGLMINFFIEKNKIRFEFNVSAAKSSGLSVDFRLLEVAKIIKSS